MGGVRLLCISRCHSSERSLGRGASGGWYTTRTTSHTPHDGDACTPSTEEDDEAAEGAGEGEGEAEGEREAEGDGECCGWGSECVCSLTRNATSRWSIQKAHSPASRHFLLLAAVRGSCDRLCVTAASIAPNESKKRRCGTARRS